MELLQRFKFTVLLYLNLLLTLDADALNIRWRVSTKQGNVVGTLGKSREGRQFIQWLGIPYAEPPIGPLRFQPPKPLGLFKQYTVTTKYPPQCVQVHKVSKEVVGEEDCLYLNIFKPRLHYNGSLPVMLFIHGGYFQSNSGEQFNPSYFMDENVILVTINYRLGVLGFLNTGDGVVRGNMGLKDQAIALKWVYENIVNFGGDPAKITVFGQSAGAVSAHMQMISPLSRGYVHKVISQSGTGASATWGLYKDPVGQAKWLAKETKCTANSTEKMVECLMSLDLCELYKFWRSKSVFSSGSSWTKKQLFVPTIETVQKDDTFLGEDPEIMLKNEDFAKIPWLVGSNSGEGLILAARYFREENLPERRAFIKHWNVTSELLLNLKPKERFMNEEIRNYYFPNLNDTDSEETFRSLRDLVSDRCFFMEQQDAVKLHSRVADAFVYYYDNPGEFSIFDRVQPKSFYGSDHGDEMYMLTPYKKKSISGKHQPDYQFSKDLVNLWVQFASDRPILSFQNKPFKPFNASDEFRYFMLRDGSAGPITAPFKMSYIFWKDFENRAENSVRLI